MFIVSPLFSNSYCKLCKTNSNKNLHFGEAKRVLPCVYSRRHGWQKLPTPTGFAFWRGKQNTPHACHPHRLSRRRNQPPSSLAAAPRACLARRLAPPPPHVPPAAAMTQAAVSGREGGRDGKPKSRAAAVAEESTAVTTHADGGGVRRAPNLARSPAWRSHTPSRGGSSRPRAFGSRVSPVCRNRTPSRGGWTSTGAGSRVAADVEEPPVVARSGPVPSLPPPCSGCDKEPSAAAAFTKLDGGGAVGDGHLLPGADPPRKSNPSHLVVAMVVAGRTAARPFPGEAGSAHRMHLRREGMHFYTSPLS
jgi:hypothetical protein